MQSGPPSTLYEEDHPPKALSAYRTYLFAQLYANVRSIKQTVCWAAGALRLPSWNHDMMLLPGEQHYQYTKLNYHLQSRPVRTCTCGYDRSDWATSKDVARTVKECALNPDRERPLLCRLSPLRMIKTGERSFDIAYDPRFSLGAVSPTAIEQAMHDMSQVLASLWAFLGPSWWATYSRVTGTNEPSAFKVLGSGVIELTEDQIVSSAAGTPKEYATELLAEMADPNCLHCREGIEFIDHQFGAVPPHSAPLPPKLRCFDICRYCVRPKLIGRVQSERMSWRPS